MSQRNILVILTDQHRLDSIGAYGSTICKTPHIDALADSGARFDNAYSVCALCTPARASIYTGMYPHHHGLITNTNVDFCKTEFDDSDKLISSYFLDNGYRCGFIGKWHCGNRLIPKDFGFEGMSLARYGHEIVNHPEYLEYLKKNNLERGQLTPLGKAWSTNHIMAGTLSGQTEAMVPYFVAERTISQLESYASDDKPFLLFCNFWGPHQPYFPTEPYASMYDPRDIPPWGHFEDDFSGKPRSHRRYLDALLGPNRKERSWEECAQWLALYYGSCTMVDDQIGRIMDSLDELGLGSSTNVIMSTDHGDLIGAHGGMHDKGVMMYQDTYHIPMIVQGPGCPAGAVVDEMVTNMDIMPTLLDFADIEPSEQLDGRSIIPLLDGSGIPDWEEDVYCEFFGHHYLCEVRMVVNKRYKYVFNITDFDELYDLEKDPWELHNLIDDAGSQEIARHMQKRLIHWADKSGDGSANFHARNLFLKRDDSTPRITWV